MTVGIIGCFQNGKSTIVNCFLGTKLAQTGGDGLSVTSANIVYCYSPQNTILSINGKKNKEFKLSDITNGKIKNAKEICIGCNSPILKSVTIIDTPGFNANSKDTEIALQSLENIDFVVVVINNKGLSEIEINVFKELEMRKIPYYLLANCLMQQAESTWNPDSEFNKKIIRTIVAQLDNYHLTPMQICGNIVTVVNSLWYWFAKTKFQSDDEEKRKSLMRFIDLYKEEYPQTDFLQESNFIPIFKFFSCNINLLPIRIYLALQRNMNKTIDYLSTYVETYSKQIQEITMQECKSIRQNIITLIKQIELTEKDLYRCQKEKEEYDRTFIFEQPRIMIEKVLKGDFVGFAERMKILLSSNDEINENLRNIAGQSKMLLDELKSQESYLNLLSTMFNHKNN